MSFNRTIKSKIEKVIFCLYSIKLQSKLIYLQKLYQQDIAAQIKSQRIDNRCSRTNG